MRYIFILSCLLLFSCNNESPTSEMKETMKNYDFPGLSLKQANNLAELPLKCAETEYPNKLNNVIGSEDDLLGPKVLHPAFYGCFDWHSAVHGHWSIVYLLKNYPKLEKRDKLMAILERNITEDNITSEVAYFHAKHNKSWERTYGWAWLLKLQEELDGWDNPKGIEMAKTLQPLTNLMVERYEEFLPKLVYPIRVGEHPNTAFGLSFALDYARSAGNKSFETSIESAAKRYYIQDENCPISWEPGGFDFLSPCLEEASLMVKVLKGEERVKWIKAFLPTLSKKDFDLAVAEVSDRTDGKLVHLDGANFSRAWNMYQIAVAMPNEYGHLRNVANKHVQKSLPNLVDDSYEGGHWLGSFAIYALDKGQ